MRCANIAHGVCPPLTAKTKRPWSATAACTCSATKCAPRSATLSASGRTSISSGIELPRLLVVAAELLAHRREELIGVQVEPARGEAGVERRRQYRRRDADVDSGGRGPATLPGVGDAPGELLE